MGRDRTGPRERAALTPWTRKLDPRARSALEAGGAPEPMELVIGLSTPLTPDQLSELEAAGLTPYSRTGTVISGRVDDLPALRRVVEAGFVRRVELARPLHLE
jgi:hypothetical protein